MKKEKLQYILRLTQLQQAALKKEDIEQWTSLMQKRKEAMEQLDELHKQNPELKEQKEEEILKGIIVLDNQNKQEFKRQFEAVKNNLKIIRSQQKIGNIYLNPYDLSQEEGIFFDKK